MTASQGNSAASSTVTVTAAMNGTNDATKVDVKNEASEGDLADDDKYILSRSATIAPTEPRTSTSIAVAGAAAASSKERDTGFGIPLTKFRSLEPVISPAAPLARILSGPRDSTDGGQYVNTYLGRGTAQDPYLVDWLAGERANPYNWSNGYRWIVTITIAVATLCISFASSSYSGGLDDIEKRFGVSTEVGILGISLYVVGFGVGPLVWAPLSEIYGRTLAFSVSYPIFTIFNIVGAVAQNMETILVARFLAGTFGSAPITNAGGQVSDMWAAHERALATSVFSLAPFLGPVFGPIVGGFVGEAKGFRWVFWVQFFFALVCFIVSMIVVPETYAPTLLRRKAKKLQAEADAAGTGEFFIAKYDKVKRTKAEVLKTNLKRPFQLLASELIVACLGIYGMIVYGTLYLFFEAFPIVFREYRGWSLGISGLAFIGIGVGLVIGNLLTPFVNRFYKQACDKAAARGEKVAPEARLVGCSIGACLLPIGLFWFAWTSTPNIHFIVPMLAAVPFGCGFLLIFTGMQLYLIDAYALFAASALASNAVLRSLAGAAFPLFAVQMYDNLGLQWAGTLVAFLSLACTPMPFLFFRYGAVLRRNSKYAPSGLAAKESSDSALEPEYAADAGESQGVEAKRIGENMV